MSAALPAFLNRERWQRFVLSSITGSFVGICIGNTIWPPNEKAFIAIPLFVTLGTVATAVVALPSAFVVSRLSVPHRRLRGGAWFALIITVAFGPTCVALTPPFVARRVARNEEFAADRVMALQRAVERTLAGPDRSEICDGSVLSKNYTGPAFSDEDWRRIVGNYVRQDGYIFTIYCHKKSVYGIDARPFRDQEDGNRIFCTDESGKMGCGDRIHWDVCVPCSK
jgi:hypothetical protein